MTSSDSGCRSTRPGEVAESRAVALRGVSVDPWSGKAGTFSRKQIREYGLNSPERAKTGLPGTPILPSHVAGNRSERGATRVTTSVNPKQSTGRPAG